MHRHHRLDRSGPTRLRERGQGTLDLIGVVVVVAALVGAVVLAVGTSDSAIAASVRQNVCTVLTAGQGDCGSTPAVAPAGADSMVPTYLDPALTPQQRAESGRYVALGDSFSSGEGGSAYDPMTDENRAAEAEDYYEAQQGDPPMICFRGGCVESTPDEDPFHNLCHRSEGAYAHHVGAAFDFADGYTFAACSGALTSDFTHPNADNVDDPDRPWAGNDGEPAQLDHLDADTSLVTLTIGGNDANFAGTLSDCIADGINPFASCLDDADERDEVQADIERAIEAMRDVLPQVRERAPNARILVVGYPRFFPPDPGSAWSDGTQIDTVDILAINDLVADMNDEIEDLVAELDAESGGYTYVDVEDAFGGCEIGTPEACMNNIEIRFADGKPDKNGSYHPNDRGHEALAEIVEEAVRDAP